MSERYAVTSLSTTTMTKAFLGFCENNTRYLLHIYWDKSLSEYFDKMNEINISTIEDITDLTNKALAPRTLETYRYKWGTYTGFCKSRDVQALPSDPKVVSAYLLGRSKKCATQTVQGDRLAISWKHRSGGYDDPTKSQLVSRTMKTIHQRAKPNEGSGPMHPLLTKDIKEMIDSLSLEEPSDEDGVWEKAMYLRALRNRALILVGYAAALRASELAKVQLMDFDFNQRGMEVNIKDTKTKPRTVGVSFSTDARYCPVRSLKEWTGSVEFTSGPVFRQVFNSTRIADRAIHRKTVWRVIKGAAKEANVDKADQVGAHSVRRGHATQAVLNGVSLERLQKQLGHQDPATTAKYVRDARRMQEETSQDLGL